MKKSKKIIIIVGIGLIAFIVISLIGIIFLPFTEYQGRCFEPQSPCLDATRMTFEGVPVFINITGLNSSQLYIIQVEGIEISRTIINQSDIVNNSYVFILSFQHDGVFYIRLLDNFFNELDVLVINIIDVSQFLGKL